MSTRSTRRSTANASSSSRFMADTFTPAPPDMTTLTTLDRLLLAQAVHELGANAWQSVAKLLSKHPLLVGYHPKTFFNPHSCHAMYTHLMVEAGLECIEANNAPHAPMNLKLAQRNYVARVKELRELIAGEEIKFRRIVAEIEEIRSGLWDDRIVSKITGAPLPTPSSPSQNERKSKSKSKSRGPEVPEVVVTSTDVVSDLGSAVAPPISRSPSLIVEEREELQVMEETTPIDDEVDDEAPADENSANVMAEEPEQELDELDDGGNASPEELEPELPGIEPRVASEAEMVTEEQGDDEDDNMDVDTENGIIEGEETRPETSQEEEEADRDVVAEANQESQESIDARGTSQVTQDEDRLETHDDAGQDQDDRLGDAEAEAEGNSETVLGVTASEPSEANADESEDEEPLVARRSTRHRHVSPSPPAAPIPAVKPKTRLQQRMDAEAEAGPEASLSPTAMDVDEGEEESKADSSQATDEVGPRRQDKRKAGSAEGIDSPPRDKKRARDDSEPVEEDEPEPGPSSSTTRRRRAPTEEQVALKRFQNVIGMLHSQISQHRNGNIFHNPIKNSEAPDYHEIVRRPIDLKTIKTKIKDGAIANSSEFQRDVYLMFANAMMYNRPGSDVYNMAEDMMLESEGYISTFRQTEGFARLK